MLRSSSHNPPYFLFLLATFFLRPADGSPNFWYPSAADAACTAAYVDLIDIKYDSVGAKVSFSLFLSTLLVLAVVSSACSTSAAPKGEDQSRRPRPSPPERTVTEEDHVAGGAAGGASTQRQGVRGHSEKWSPKTLHHSEERCSVSAPPSDAVFPHPQTEAATSGEATSGDAQKKKRLNHLDFGRVLAVACVVTEHCGSKLYAYENVGFVLHWVLRRTRGRRSQDTGLRDCGKTA